MESKNLKAEAAELISEAVSYFGENGEGWTTGKFENSRGQVCAIGALDKAARNTEAREEVVVEAFKAVAETIAAPGLVEHYTKQMMNMGLSVRLAYGGFIWPFNDTSTFRRVKAKFCEAIKRLLNEDKEGRS